MIDRRFGTRARSVVCAVRSPDLIAQLADERLQRLLLSIDGSANREQALVLAQQQQPAFAHVAEQARELLVCRGGRCANTAKPQLIHSHNLLRLRSARHAADVAAIGRGAAATRRRSGGRAGAVTVTNTKRAALMRAPGIICTFAERGPDVMQRRQERAGGACVCKGGRV